MKCLRKEKLLKNGVKKKSSTAREKGRCISENGKKLINARCDSLRRRAELNKVAPYLAALSRPDLFRLALFEWRLLETRPISC